MQPAPLVRNSAYIKLFNHVIKEKATVIHSQRLTLNSLSFITNCLSVTVTLLFCVVGPLPLSVHIYTPVLPQTIYISSLTDTTVL